MRTTRVLAVQYVLEQDKMDGIRWVTVHLSGKAGRRTTDAGR